MRHLRILKGRKPKTIAKTYTKEELQKLGDKDPTVQGLSEMLDVNKLVKRITHEQIKNLREKQMNGNYGIQQNSTLRDIMLQNLALKKDFMSLDPLVREHFKNNEFDYLKFLEDNKENKYALAELTAEVTKSDAYKRHVDEVKRKEIQQQEQLANEQKALADLIKNAVSPEQGSS